MKNKWFVIAISFSILVASNSNAAQVTVSPTEKINGLIRNPGMGWVIYCDAFGQMVSNNIPDYNKGVFYPELFWQTLDSSGATDKASIFYLRAPWSFYETSEGNYAWDDKNSNFYKLVQGALDRGLKLSFRVYVNSKDSWQQATPNYVKMAGASGYMSNGGNAQGESIPLWNAFANDQVFLSKLKVFITAFGNKYNDPDTVDFIDGMGLGNWGELHGIRYDNAQPGNNQTAVLNEVTNAYREAFPLILLGAQQGGPANQYSHNINVSNKYDILRRDSMGMPRWLSNNDKKYYAVNVEKKRIPLFAENGWNYFAHDFEGYMAKNGTPFTSIRDMLVYSLNDVITSRANTFDLRVPEDALEWMRNEDLVDDFIVNGGYRLSPTSLTYPDSIESNTYLTIHSEWKNTAIGILPNNRPAWNYKYKVAYALLDQSTGETIATKVTNIDPSHWLKGKNYSYNTSLSFGEIVDGNYNFAFAIVDTSRENKPAIELAITQNKTQDGWYILGATTVSKIANTAPLPDLQYFNLAQDFSTKQGENQWSYLESDSLNMSAMTFSQSDNNWHGIYPWNLISNNSLPLLHPDRNDTVVAWQAPKKGKIRVTGNPKKDNIGGGDGVNVKILKNGTQLWPSSGWITIESDDDNGSNHNFTTSVSRGDFLYFIVNSNGTNSWDGTHWDPSIEYITHNVAPQATVTTTFSTSSNTVITAINDNNDTSAWGSGTSPSYPNYITLDFNSQSISTGKITLATHYGSGQGITNIDLEYYNGVNWESIIKNKSISWVMNDKTVEYLDINFNTISTNKLRLKINNANAVWNKLALNEFKVWSGN